MRLSVLASIALFAALIPCGGQAQSDLPPPLPERNPLRPGAPVPPKPLAPAEFQTEPWTAAEVTAATDACKTLLASVTLDYEQLAPIKEGVCGAPAPILLRSVGNDPKVEINPPATISCPLAKALSVWLSKIVQPEAKALLGSEVVGLHNATSYACRNRNGGAETPLSEHALANALDVSEFKLASGDSITVLKGWPRAVPPPPAPLPNPVRDETVARSASPEA
ncbi:MAG: extensin family protein, partial [Methyloceanibacter sp.]